MKRVFNISIEQVIPSIDVVLNSQDIPKVHKTVDRTIRLAQEAITIYRQNTTPIGLLMEIPKNDFDTIFFGEDNNTIDTPIRNICQSAESLALFVVTVGEKICSKIREFFSKNDFALGSMFDSTASEGVELCAQAIEDTYRQQLLETGKFCFDSAVMRFSPGYCGWHISAQQKLFQALHPEEIGIKLNNSFLMQPLKSISGVIVYGKKNIFNFENNFSFCSDCTTRICKERTMMIR